ncbi:MAG: iron uptake transporter deferrochelatase/peroxidase subunit [Baekduia sp.]
MADARPMVRLRRSAEPGSSAVSRRAFLALGGAGVAATLTATGCGSAPTGTKAAAKPPIRARTSVPFHGAHQAGIVTAQQRHLRFAAFDLQATRREDLEQLLRAWTDVAATLTAGHRVTSADPAKSDTGEAADLPAARLTVTFGFGPSLFEHDGLGLASQRPVALEAIPGFGADALDRTRSDGDMAIQVCADDSQVAFHAIHALIGAARGVAEPRWLQSGFLGEQSAGTTPRNLLGFKDGSRNLDVRDDALTGRHLWANAADGTPWMDGGSYLVARRVRTVLDVWDATSTAGQESTIGRHKASGAPLSGQHEHDEPDFSHAGPGGLTIPADAHIRLAAPEHNHGAQLLRRGYNYDDGIDHDTGQIDAGLFFICFQRDPRRQFVPIQRRLARSDALGQHLIHTASAVFACPPGVAPGGYVGQQLLAS